MVSSPKSLKTLIVDDIVDTAGTLCSAAKALLENGAKSVIACITHPVLSGPAVERVANSPLHRLVVTDTIPLSEAAKKCPKIVPLTVAPLLAQAIVRIHQEDSISSLFEIQF